MRTRDTWPTPPAVPLYNIITFYPVAVVPRGNVFTKSYDQNARGRCSRRARVSFNVGVNNTYENNNIIYKHIYYIIYGHRPGEKGPLLW